MRTKEETMRRPSSRRMRRRMKKTRAKKLQSAMREVESARPAWAYPLGVSAVTPKVPNQERRK
jgi:hypothetical protein